MTTTDALPIACTLGPGEFDDRLASIAALNREALLHHERRDLVLELRYAPEARSRVRQLVRSEQKCCAFLRFHLNESTHEVRLTITAPKEVREAADMLFEKFVAEPSQCSTPAYCACSAAGSASPSNEPLGSKAAGAAAITLSAGAVACGACCVLPFILPTTILAGTGSLLSSFIHMHWWMTGLSVFAVVGAWGWMAWQMHRTGRKPARATLVMMIASTVFMTVSLIWPLIEKPLIRALRA